MLKDKRGQTSETITWIIATIILIVILAIFIFSSVALSKTKSIKVNLKSDLEEEADWIDSKTNFAYSVNSANRNKISSWISEERDYDK